VVPERRTDLDLAKGLAIFLVVFGHLVAREPPSGNQWYVVLQQAVYLFHMPFFMYLSGYVTFLSGSAVVVPEKWPGLVARRANRLLVPFLLFGLLIIAGKLILSRVMYVDNVPTSASAAILGIVWHTDQSPATSVWYIAVLFMFCIITPLLMRLVAGRVVVLLGGATILYFLPLPHVMYLDRFGRFYVFFLVGGYAAQLGEGWIKRVDQVRLLAALVFLVAVCFSYGASSKWSAEAFLVCGLLSMPALHGLVRTRPLDRSKLLLTLGIYSFVIYLLNTLFIGLAKGAMLRMMPWDGANFLLFAPLMLAAGIVLPVALKKYGLRHFPWLDRITS